MSDYWKKKLEELEQEKEAISTSYWDRKQTELETQKTSDVWTPKKDEDIAPIKSEKDDGKLDFFQRASVFDDGEGTVAGDVAKTILGTVGDAGLGIVKGVGRLVEGVTDLGAYAWAGVSDLVGEDGYAERVKRNAQKSRVDEWSAGADEFLDKYSVLGRTSDAVAEGIGQVGAIILTGGLGSAAGLSSAGVTALTTGTMGLSSMGSGMGEAYQGGATDGEAFTYGLIAGAADAATELLFGGLGKAVKATGLSTGLSSADDMLAKKVSSVFQSQIAKNFSEFGIKAGAEGVEEVLAGVTQAVGKKITYMSEEELSEILADENLLEQFVVGAVTSGMLQSGVIPGTQEGSLIEANKEGKDFITGYNQNEQAVIAKEVENRIAEAEADGTKLTAKQKSAIEAQVEKAMEKGYISTDLIEEVVGGDTYKSYKSHLDKEAKLQKEYDTLYKMKQGDMTGEQTDRLAALKEQLAAIKDRPLSKQMKNLLDQEVSEKVKGSRLMESYNEKARRGQAFEADLSKYDKKQQAVIQKAVESGILNNTNRTHEFVDMVAKISADKGVLFDFTNNEKLKTSGFAMEGKTVNGFVTKDGVTLNVQSAKALNSVVGHEIAHVLEGTDLYTELQNAVVEYAKTKGDYQGRLDSLSKLYESVEGANINAELTADLVGDYLFTDPDFINNLSTNHRNVFQKIYDEVKYLLKVTTAGSKEARELEKVKRAFEKAYREGGKAQSDTKYSLTEPFTDSNGTHFDNAVLLDTDFFDGTSPRNWGDKLRTLVNERASTNPFILPITDENGNTTILQFASPNDRVTKDGASNHKVLDKLTSSPDNISKLAVVHIDEIVSVSEENSPYYTNENNHQWLDKNGWLHRNANVINQKNGNIYNLTVDIAKAADGRTILYATEGKIKKVGSVQVNSLKIKGSGLNSNFSNKVAQNGSDVKPSLSAEQADSDIRFSLSEAVEETRDLMAFHNLTEQKLLKSLKLGGLPMPSVAIAKAQDGHSEFGEISLILPKETIDPQSSSRNKLYSGDAWTPTYPKVDYKPSRKVLQEAEDRIDGLVPYKVQEVLGSLMFDTDNVTNALDRYNGNMVEAYKNNDSMKYAYLKDTGSDISLPMKEADLIRYGTNSNAAVRYFAGKLVNGLQTVEHYRNMSARDTLQDKALTEAVADAQNFDVLRTLEPGSTEYLEYERNPVFRADEVSFRDVDSFLSAARKLFTEGIQQTVDRKAAKELINETVDQAAYERWLEKLFDGVVEKEGIRNNKDYFTPSGNRRSFEALHYEHNLENVIKAMREKGEKGIGNGFGGASIFGASTTEFSSVEEMKQSSDRLQRMSYDEYQELRKGFTDRFLDIAMSLPNQRNSFSATDSAAEVLTEAVAKYKTRSGIANYLRRELKGWATYSEQVVDDLIELVNDIRKMPTGYFEAKPQRAVGFDEVAVFVIPYDADVKLKQELLNRGYNIAEYDPKVEGDRQRIVNQFEEYKFSLSDAGAVPKAYGSYNVYGKDIALEAPVQEEVAPVGVKNTPTVSEVESVAPVDISETETTTEDSTAVEDLFPDDLAPVETELENLYQQKIALEGRMTEAMNGEDLDGFTQANTEYDEVMTRIEALEGEISERTGSLDDADVPPGMEAPYPGEPSGSESVPDPFADRDMFEVGKRKVKAYQFENPEVRPFFREAAIGMLDDLHRTTKGEKIFNGDVYYQTGGEKGWDGTKRSTTADIAALLDEWHYTYAQIEEGLNDIIEDHGKENNAVSKRIEFMLDDRLRNGYTDVWGEPMPANQEYINFLKEKQITEYSKEAFDRFMETADQYAPPAEDIAPVKPERSEQMKLPLYHDPNKVSPAMGEVQTDGDIAPAFESEGGQQAIFEPVTIENAASTRKALHTKIMDNIKTRFAENGFDFDAVLKKAKNLSTFATVDNIPQRVMEKALGYKEGGILSDITVNQVAQNETAGIVWLNKQINTIKEISKQYHIKPGSKESAAAQMYAEGFYVNGQNEIIRYGDAELAADFPDMVKQAQIKGLARDSRIRKIYDDTLKSINESRTRNAYPEIPRLDNYFLHFRAMNDTFSKLGLPFNPNDIRAKDLPTDLNGVTADLKPGQPFFASAMHREGKRTSFDLLGGLEQYLNSAKNQIYHIDDIQTLRALRNYVADTYGQANGLEGLDMLSEEEQQQRIEQVYNSHLSTFAKFLNEEANVLAGKTSLIDRGVEGIIGRRGITFLDTVNKQVGKNMVGFNVSSSLTNFLPVVQTFAKTNKFDFIKALAQTTASKLKALHGETDSFVENNPTIIRRKGAEKFSRTPYEKISDAGYVLMSAVDDISTEIIVRAKYNELTRKGMSEQKAAFETDKWVSRLMGDRSLGQQPQLYNSKMLGLLTKFQLEVRNQLDSQFYDTIQEAKVSNEDIENRLLRNAKTAAKVGSTFFQLAVAQHVFGKAFESVAGYNPAFDIIEALATAFGWDDDEEDEDTVLDNIEQGFLVLLEDLPYTSTFTGGRIPISSALPVKQLITGKDQYGNEKSRLKTLAEVAPYYVAPGGYGQVKKTVAGLKMFSSEHPIAGSYTDSGNLRFPVEDTLANRAQAAIFGQWASSNARDYFDNERKALTPKQTQELIDVDMSIQDYWNYREGLSGLSTLEQKLFYIDSLNLTTAQKNVLANNLTDRQEAIDMSDYDQFPSLAEFDYANDNPEKYAFFGKIGITYEQYQNADDDAKDAYNWAFKNPEQYTLSKAVAGDVVEYRKYASDLYDIKADKDEDGKSISGSRKEKVIDYINSLDIDYGAKLILFKNEYNSDNESNYEIIEYLNNREDISFEEEVTILRELGFTVTDDGTVYWD